MKKIIPILFAALAVYSCVPSDSDTTIPSSFKLSVEPKSVAAFAGEALPVLTLKADPSSALEGALVKWTSDSPDVVEVAQNGALKFVVSDIAEPQKLVTITAEVSGVSASMTVTVKGQISKYKIIDMTESLGFSILDRNVGATSVSDPGHYFQWGKNEPVTVKTVDKSWSAAGPKFSDWSKPGQSPCPKGWEPMSSLDKNSFESFVSDIISDYESSLAEGFPSNYSKDEYEKACELWKTMNFVPAGCILPSGGTVTNPSQVYVWTASRKKGEVNKFFYVGRGTEPVLEGKSPVADVAVAMGLRCVKTDKYQMMRLKSRMR